MTDKFNSLFQLNKTELVDALANMGVSYEESAILKLEQFINILCKWNKVYNLTAIRDPQQMVTHHLLDSLAVLPYLDGHDVLDVGSGAGFPGIPLAIFKPELSFTLLDSNRKKTRFIAQAAIELALNNVQVATSRVEAYQPGKTFDTVITRAFASVEKILSLTGSLCAPQGKFLLMKGVVPEQELKQLPGSFEVSQIVRLNVPKLAGERHLIILESAGSLYRS